MIWRHSIFPTCHTFDVILGHISALDRDLQILTFAWSSPVTRYMSGWGFCFISSWLPGGLSLGRFIRLTLSDVCVIFVWSHRAHGVSHHPFRRSTCQVFYASPLSYSWVITLGHTPILEFIRSFVYFLTARSISWSLWVIILGHTPFIAFPTGSYTPLFGFAMVIHPSLWVCHVSCWFHDCQTHLSIFISHHLV